MKTIIIRKRDSASRGYGRGVDNVYSPASYEIVKDGKVVGYILGASRGYMEPAHWDVVNSQYRTIRMFWSSQGKPFTKAKAFAIRHWR